MHVFMPTAHRTQAWCGSREVRENLHENSNVGHACWTATSINLRDTSKELYAVVRGRASLEAPGPCEV